jgi:hypothetical protein
LQRTSSRLLRRGQRKRCGGDVTRHARCVLLTARAAVGAGRWRSPLCYIDSGMLTGMMQIRDLAAAPLLDPTVYCACTSEAVSMTVIFQATVRPSTKAIPLELDRDASGEEMAAGHDRVRRGPCGAEPWAHQKRDVLRARETKGQKRPPRCSRRRSCAPRRVISCRPPLKGVPASPV